MSRAQQSFATSSAFGTRFRESMRPPLRALATKLGTTHQTLSYHLNRKILGEEFACARAAGEDLEELRAFLAERGVSVPEHVSGSDSSEALPQNRQESGSPPEGPAHPYVRRANNQVSPETEALIRELLTQGQTKSAITRALRVNRRVVIRVAREMLDVEHRRVHTGSSQWVGSTSVDAS